MAEEDKGEEASSVAISDAIRNFIPNHWFDNPTCFLKELYKTVEIHDGFTELPTMAPSSTKHIGSITFRVDKDIELVGFLLHGLKSPHEAEQNPSSKKRSNKKKQVVNLEYPESNTITGSFTVFKDEVQIDKKHKVEMLFPKNDKSDGRFKLPLSLTVPFAANNWYTIEFKLKGTHKFLGTGLKSSASVNLDPFGPVNFDIKGGVNQGKIRGILFNVLNGDECTRSVPDDCHFFVQRYGSFGLRKYDGEENGEIKFKVSASIDVVGVSFFGLKTPLTKDDDFVMYSGKFSVENVNTGVKHGCCKNVFMCNKGELVHMPACQCCQPIRLEADVVYKLSFRIRGPKLRFGEIPIKSVTVANNQNYYKTKSVTFTFLSEIRSTQLANIDFTFFQTVRSHTEKKEECTKTKDKKSDKKDNKR